jgi:hypothetical protein
MRFWNVFASTPGIKEIFEKGRPLCQIFSLNPDLLLLFRENMKKEFENLISGFLS